MDGKKSAVLMLPFAVGAFVGVANASITTAGGSLNNTTGQDAVTTTVTADALSHLRRQVSVQASAGVLLVVEDDTHAEVADNELGVATCHVSGNTEYFATSEGGGVQQGGNITTCNTGNLDFQT